MDGWRCQVIVSTESGKPSEIDLERFKQLEMQGRPTSSQVPRTMLGTNPVSNKCFLDESTTERTFPKKEAGFTCHALSLLLRKTETIPT